MSRRLGLLRLWTLSAVTAVVLSLCLGTAYAAAPASANVAQPTKGITVVPAQITLELSKGQTFQATSTSVRNDFDYPVTLTASLTGVDTSTGKLLPSDSVEQTVAHAVTITPTRFTLQPKQAINVRLALLDNKDIAPGGHYIALLIQPQTTQQKSVSVRGVISVSVYVIKHDGAVSDLRLQNVVLHRRLWGMPSSLKLLFQNNGNVTSVPRGAIDVYRGGSLDSVAHVAINQSSLPVYPAEQQQLQTEIPRVNPFLPGKYLLSIHTRAEDQTGSKLTVVRFFYIPLWLLLAGAAGLLAGVWYLWKRLKSVKKAKTTDPVVSQVLKSESEDVPEVKSTKKSAKSSKKHAKKAVKKQSKKA